jgi:hypothetical protein
MRLGDARVNAGIGKYALPVSPAAARWLTGPPDMWIHELSRAYMPFGDLRDLRQHARTSTNNRRLSAASSSIFLSISLIELMPTRETDGGFPY